MYKDPASVRENTRVKEDLLRYISPGMDVLDLGCGTGLFLDLVGHTPNYFGIDISPAMIDRARMKWGEYQRVHFTIADVDDVGFIGYNSHTLGLVVSLFGAFSHFTKPESLIRDIHRILKPGGHFYVMPYSRYPLTDFFKGRVCKFHTRNSKNDYGETTAYTYTVRELYRLFSVFSDVKVTGLNMGLINRSPRVDEWITKKIPDLGYTLIVKGVKDG